jgi:hypothetical protein
VVETATPQSTQDKPAEAAPPTPPPVATVPEVNPTSKPATTPKPKLSAIDQIRAKAKRMQAGNLVDSIEQAREVKNDVGSIEAFLEAVELADSFADMKSDREDARQQWYSLGLTEVKERLEDWARSGNATAVRPILDVLEAFNLKINVTSSLWLLVTEILRPARNIKQYGGLRNLLESLKVQYLKDGKSVVAMPVNGNNLHPDDKVKMIVIPGRDLGYLPVMGDPQINAVWRWLKVAEARAKEDLDACIARLDELAEEATCQNAGKVLSGDKGTFLIRPKPESGILFEFFVSERGIMIKAAEVIGIPPRHCPGLIRWNASGSVWPQGSGMIFQAFEAWKKKG